MEREWDIKEKKKDMTHNSTVRPFKDASEYWKRRAWNSIPLGFFVVCQQWSTSHCGSPQAVQLKLFEGLKIISVSELPKGKQRPQSARWLHYCGRSLLRRDQYSSPQCTGSERVPVRAVLFSMNPVSTALSAAELYDAPKIASSLRWTKIIVKCLAWLLIHKQKLFLFTATHPSLKAQCYVFSSTVGCFFSILIVMISIC